MFLAFPLNDKPNWRNPPWMTILIILVNVLVFFGPQGLDETNADKAARYYLTSPLPALELPRYAEYLRQRDKADSRALADKIDASVAAGRYAPAVRVMLNDPEFEARLHAGRIVRPEEPEYPLWREQHMQYESIRGTPFTERWASNPSAVNPVTLFTSMFLHGGVAHLIGNMVFLFVFGYTVEKTLGARRYLAFYILAGLGGAIADAAVRWGSHIPSLGASGAISGLMAMYVMLYGRQRIKFFYQFLFYFDYVTAPAIILLPAWIAHELFQQWFGGEGVAYMAHAGGLVTGALLLAWHKRKHPDTKVVVNEAPPELGLEELARAEGLLKQLRTDEARVAFAQLAGIRPADRRVLSQYFNLAKLKPSSPEFHHAAALIFALNESDGATSALVHASFTAYMKTAKPAPQLSPADLARLALRFARDGHGTDAAALAKVLLGRAPDHADLPRVLLGAIFALRKKGEAAPAGELSRLLSERFPKSSEARMAAEGARA